MIEVREVTKHYGDKEVLKKVSFEIKENEIFALLGPNGAGKTTILECMEGLRKYDNGEIKLMGLDPDEVVKKGVVGIQLQSSSLPNHICAKDAMNLFCLWNGVAPRYDLLDTFELEEIDRKPYKAMSTGQKRKLHLALALAHDPKILFLDEPTAGLDVEARVSLHKEIRKLKQKGVTIILASHDMAEVEALCDRVAILVEGRIRKIASPSDIVLDVRRETIIKLRLDKELAKIPFSHVQLQEKTNGYVHFTTDNLLQGLMELLQYIKTNHYQLLDLSIDKPSLEERYIEIAKEKNAK
ncbi:ABC transporter ATP-binding protein [Amphibacillus sp. Q70]|uniref:ABC transporter ATP-binding protein n=1 Tax=Amphibacillus sp. Q70 TaxID=3453416 RepID=UPI003F83BB14